MDLGIRNRVALVTGASRGIGKAIASVLAREGCKIAICSRNTDALQAAARDIETYGGQVIWFQADCTKADDVAAVVKNVTEKFGGIDILVNNVGGTAWAPQANIEDTPESFWQDIYERNAGAAIKFTTLCIPHMRKKKWGRVVTIISKQGREGGGKPWYTMAKSAEMAMMKSLAMTPELARDGITFNSIAPGAVITEEGNWADLKRDNPARFEERMKMLPYGRIGKSEEIAEVVAFVCSERASLLSGASIPVDGAESKAF